MASFTNYATLSYNGGTAVSNTVTGQILDLITATKVAVSDSYRTDGSVTYVITLVNSGQTDISGLNVTDNLGAYTFSGRTIYPLSYTAGSMRYYVNGILQPALTVTGEPILAVNGINIPACGNAMLIYEASVTDYAPPSNNETITNTATVTGPGITTPITATEVVYSEGKAELGISKSLSPAVVTNNSQLTYTFVIENRGNLPTNTAVLTDTFDPVLNPISVSLNGTAWTEGTNYTYNTATGEFSTISGQITVPAATFSQNSDGLWLTTPGTVTLAVTGTI